MPTAKSQPALVAERLGGLWVYAWEICGLPEPAWKGSIVVLWFVIGSPLLLTSQPVDQASTRSPHGNLDMACQACHTSMSWKPIRPLPDFDHNKTRYPLLGMHKSLTSCTQCHTKLVFTEVGHACADCHADLHRGQLGANCEACHSVKGWQVSIQDIKQHQNRFPLIGAHAVVTCDACHTGAATGQFTGLSTACISCHATDFRQTTNPSHTALNFPTDCQQCHSMNSWIGVQFDHNKFTSFPLTGAHASVACAQCHTTSNFAAAPTQCVGCHMANFQQTTSPSHVSGGYPRTCEMCHNTTTWLNSTFNHNNFPFQLTGAHASVQCSQCHTSSNFAAAPTQCAGCHMANFRQTTSPNHVTGGYPQTCEMCHNTTTWLNSTFNHNNTPFPLTGAHTSVQCSQCHTSSNFAAAPTQCVGCHLSTFQSTTNPPHQSGAFPQTCQQCHNTSNWLTSSFNHNTMTKFPLTGAHTTVPCLQCHTSGPFSATSTLCASCHLQTFKQTTNPNHVDAGFPTDCSGCHSTTNWQGAVFNHNNTPFPLTGAHVGLSCNSCHGSGVFAGLPTTCVSCHLTQYQQTTNPNHVTNGYPQRCELCHNTTSFLTSTFNHNNTAFPLTGAHTTVLCSSCHVNGNFTTTPTDCYSCHQSLYNGTTNPNHVVAGFPTTCQNCHNTTAWTGATFNHTWFPIFSGTHNPNVWVMCSACHSNPSSFATFTCIACHTHTQAATDPRHTGVQGYVYAPMACYGCHKG